MLEHTAYCDRVKSCEIQVIYCNLFKMPWYSRILLEASWSRVFQWSLGRLGLRAGGHPVVQHFRCWLCSQNRTNSQQVLSHMSHQQVVVTPVVKLMYRIAEWPNRNGWKMRDFQCSSQGCWRADTTSFSRLTCLILSWIGMLVCA